MDALPETFILPETVMSKAMRAISDKDNKALRNALRLWSGDLIHADIFTPYDTAKLLYAAVKSGSVQLVKTLADPPFISEPSYDGLVHAKAMADAANNKKMAEFLSGEIQTRVDNYENSSYWYLYWNLPKQSPFFSSEEMKLITDIKKRREEHLRKINPAELALGKLARSNGNKPATIEFKADDLFFYYLTTGNTEGLEALDRNGLIATTRDYDRLLTKDVLTTGIPNVEAVANTLYSILERHIDADTSATIESANLMAAKEKAHYSNMLGVVKSVKKDRSRQ